MTRKTHHVHPRSSDEWGSYVPPLPAPVKRRPRSRKKADQASTILLDNIVRTDTSQDAKVDSIDPNQLGLFSNTRYIDYLKSKENGQ